MQIGYIILGVVALIALWAMGAYNGLVRARNVCNEAFATMDVYLVKRYDVVPQLVETVKGYAKHEKSTFEDVVAARGKALSGGASIDERIEAEEGFSRALSRLLALTEAYPELKANETFLKLMDDLKKVNDEIAHSRKYFNGAVMNYNIKIATVPTAIIAGLFRFTERRMFEATDEQRENVEVAF